MWEAFYHYDTIPLRGLENKWFEFERKRQGTHAYIHTKQDQKRAKKYPALVVGPSPVL